MAETKLYPLRLREFEQERFKRIAKRYRLATVTDAIRFCGLLFDELPPETVEAALQAVLKYQNIEVLIDPDGSLTLVH